MTTRKDHIFKHPKAIKRFVHRCFYQMFPKQARIINELLISKIVNEVKQGLYD